MNKPDKSLIETPVDNLCGNPMDMKYTGPDSTAVYGMKGPEGVSAGFVDTVLIYEDITPSAKADKPSDSEMFKGQRSDG